MDESFLQQCLSEKLLSQTDVTLAKETLHLYRHSSASLLVVFCYLLMAMRDGHLCVHVEKDVLSPPLEDLLSDDPSLTPDLLEALKKKILEGFKELPENMVEEGDNLLNWSPRPLVRWGFFYYFQRHWRDESSILHHLERLSSPFSNGSCVDLQKMSAVMEELENHRAVNEEQAVVLAGALQSKVAFICGGPGTGKTYTASLLVETLWRSLPEDRKSTYEILLTAPTGKAAAQLQANFQKRGSRFAGLKLPKAMTLHRVLNIQPLSLRDQTAPLSLSADLVIVDECSMIDGQRMAQLLAALKKEARLVLMGDPSQLPSVEAGAVFADLCHVHRNSRKGFFELRTCMRTELHEIVQFSQKIKQGSLDLMEGLGEEGDSKRGAVRLLSSGENLNEKELQKKLVEDYFSFFPLHQENKHPFSPSSFSEIFRPFCLLSPFKNGPLGVDALNQLFLKKRGAMASSQEHMFIPIMITKNDSRQELFNGDLGILEIQNKDVSFPLRLTENDEALFLSTDGSLRKIPGFLLPSFTLAYCLSVHKSQGSEFNHVVLVLPEKAKGLTREMLYTAATRARRQLDLVGKREHLIKIANCQKNRHSGLIERWEK